MVQQYNFSQLDPRGFEFLCRDLVRQEISEETGETILFNSFSEVPDEGINAILENKVLKEAFLI